MQDKFTADRFIHFVKMGLPSVALQILDDAVEAGEIVFPCGTDDSDLLPEFIYHLVEVEDEEHHEGAIRECLDLARRIDPVLSASTGLAKKIDRRGIASFPLSGVRALLQRSIDGEHPLFNRWLHEEELPWLFTERCGCVDGDKTQPFINQISFPLQ